MSELSVSQPLYQQAYEKIKQTILTGEISPGSKVVVTKLAEAYQISRTPLREALRQLQNEGLLIQDQSGTSVVQLDRKDYEELCHCRLILERQIIQLVVNEIEEEKVAEAEEVVNKAEQLVDSGKHLDILKYNTRFHEILIHSCSNRRLIQLLEQVRSLLLIYRANILKYREHNLNINQEHREIFEAVKERDVSRAVEAIECHLKNDQNRGSGVFEKS
ncbi:GntR family transcriptional regulator [Tuberibacillus sp. Marseille-P3662]|uniref:GntR family transcriptional regulator n=1 Tax=Tuberibacillus sp. Marseille-P3662 TaxID=1965358 RepID=UPI000A1CB332|nr:GntR family transcriptional regulator [Tuberibacillus sp. Marseille-P3662]